MMIYNEVVYFQSAQNFLSIFCLLLSVFSTVNISLLHFLTFFAQSKGHLQSISKIPWFLADDPIEMYECDIHVSQIKK